MMKKIFGRRREEIQSDYRKREKMVMRGGEEEKGGRLDEFSLAKPSSSK